MPKRGGMFSFKFGRSRHRCRSGMRGRCGAWRLRQTEQVIQIPETATNSFGKRDYHFLIAHVQAEKCTGCGKCVKVCPAKAIMIDSDSKAVIDSEACRGCGICATVCPNKAITFVKKN